MPIQAFLLILHLPIDNNYLDATLTLLCPVIPFFFCIFARCLYYTLGKYMDFTLFNNTDKRVVDDLKVQLKRGSKLQIAAASFSIYAFEVLRDELSHIESLQFLFTLPTFTTDKTTKEQREFYIPKLNRERNLYGTDFEIRLRNQLAQKAIARECADWIRAKVQFKTNTTEREIMGQIITQDEVSKAVYYPVNQFTTAELGCEQGNALCTQITKVGQPMSQMFINDFNGLWNDREKMHDVTEKVLESIETVYKENAPEFIYFVTLYNIFHEFLQDISEDVLPNEATGFKSSRIWNKLYNFQKDAALAIINKLERYNGCILADSVGLGKTFTALSVIKYYENRNKSVLVLCPKKLHDNWQTYRSNYKNNPIAEDRLRYDVLFHSDLSREKGMSNGINLEYVNWGNYDLVVIDESHNFRNGGKITTDENDENPRENRYLRLMNQIIRTGVKTKVLMLSATPVNNRFNDLKNQLQLAYEGKQELINPLLNMQRPIEDIFRQAQTVYNRWATYPPDERTTERLLDELDFDFFNLLDAVTIARSRKHIEKYYDTTDIGRFPERLKPISKRPPLTDLDNAINFTDIAQSLNELNLSVYAPSYYLLSSKYEKYGIDIEKKGGVSRAGREKGIRRLMAINMLKRLESSVNSFRLTLNRIKEQIDNILVLIDEFEATGIQKTFDFQEFTERLDVDDTEDDVVVGGKKTAVALADMDYITWRRDLQADQDNLAKLLEMLKDITPEHDSKLQMLRQNLQEKFRHPINEENKKVIIFTAFSDTAQYLYEQLAQPILDNAHLYTALITGNGVKTNLTKVDNDFNTLLTLFSPVSKERDVLLSGETRQIDVLIATDCISEGQNLQDCDYLINYDIHWNPVRIIQRFGRIDRIGSHNAVIQLVNYWPDMELDKYIELKGRVESRMKATILTATGDDNLLSNDEKGDLQYRRDQLRRLQEEVVDIEDMDTGINIMDLGLNEFRLDLLQYINEGHDVEHTPFGMSAVVQGKTPDDKGVIYILKNRNNVVNIGKQNLLHPFYMLHISDSGEVLCDHLHPKQLLDLMRLTCKGKKEYDKDLTKLFNRETRDGKRMEKYSELLGKAIASIVEVKQQSDIESLFSFGETTALTGDIHGLDDFELICFLVIR